jgi:antitoxin component YwqK of YwqJK toxin-antitoxin module
MGKVTEKNFDSVTKKVTIDQLETKESPDDWVTEHYLNGLLFNGRSESFWPGGSKSSEGYFSKGRQVRLWSSWYSNGQKWTEGNYKDGKVDGLFTLWYENGQKRLEVNYKDDKLDGLGTYWYKNGQKELEGNYKDGNFMSAVVWKPNGEKCPESNVKDGEGVVIYYNWDGTEDYFMNYKDGEPVKD